MPFGTLLPDCVLRLIVPFAGAAAGAALTVMLL